MNARAAAAGATAALVWAAAEPLDRLVFRCDYSDIALLGKAVSRGGTGGPSGLAMHAANGAAFGLASSGVEPAPIPVAASRSALAENAALWPLMRARRPLPPGARRARPAAAARNRAAFAQACWRHALFGWVLGGLAR